jgi:Tfp pilus assembly protein PilN
MPLTTKTNLLPREMLRVKEFEKRKWYIFGSLLAGIMIFLTLTGFIGLANKKKDAALTEASTLIERYGKFHKEMAVLEEEIDDLRVRLEFMTDVSEGRQETITTLAEVVRLLPHNLWLTEFRQDKDLLTLKGRTKGSFENINAFKSTLLESGHFTSVKVESADVLKDEDVTEDIRAFTIIIETGEDKGA